MTDASAPRCYALLPCAGVGSRSGAALPKQYVEIAGQPMVAHTLAALAQVARLAASLVVLAPDDDRFEALVPAFEGERGWVCRRGGATRADTVAGGLDELLARGARPDDWVLVHDAARPCLRAELIEQFLDELEDDAVGGLLALPLADTIKSGDGDQRVTATLPREGIWRAQTPQMFRHAELLRALEAMPSATDESQAVEALGKSPRLVMGDSANLKVTYAPDLALAEMMLRQRNGS